MFFYVFICVATIPYLPGVHLFGFRGTTAARFTRGFRFRVLHRSIFSSEKGSHKNRRAARSVENIKRYPLESLVPTFPPLRDQNGLETTTSSGTMG